MKRVLEISTRGIRLHLKDAQLLIRKDEETLATVPVEDVGVVILDSTGISISSGALKALSSHGAVVLSCDDSHHPVGLFLPLQANSLHGERLRFQVSASAPFGKNVWGHIIRAKIVNQARNLSPIPERKRLLQLAASVKSGDSGHCESQASRIYWGVVFRDLPGVPSSFRRQREGPPPNGLLNYGYAVIRAAIARALCGAGLHPGLGIHHRNRYNPFCLADDLMEPFRPFVDSAVRDTVTAGETTVTKNAKSLLIGVLKRQVNMSGKSVSVELAIERAAQSLAKAYESHVKRGTPATRAARALLLPETIIDQGS